MNFIISKKMSKKNISKIFDIADDLVKYKTICNTTPIKVKNPSYKTSYKINSISLIKNQFINYFFLKSYYQNSKFSSFLDFGSPIKYITNFSAYATCYKIDPKKFNVPNGVNIYSFNSNFQNLNLVGDKLEFATSIDLLSKYGLGQYKEKITNDNSFILEKIYDSISSSAKFICSVFIGDDKFIEFNNKIIYNQYEFENILKNKGFKILQKIKIKDEKLYHFIVLCEKI